MGSKPDDEFRSAAYPFLENKGIVDNIPNILEDPGVSPLEKGLLRAKRRWLASIYPAQLAALVDRVIEDRRDSPISTAVVLGLAGPWRGLNDELDVDERDRVLQQFVAFLQILAQLGAAHPELLDNLILQDPLMKREWKELCENHGFQIMENPDAFERLGPDTVLFSPYVEMFYLCPALKDKAYSDLGMFVGDGSGMIRNTEMWMGRLEPWAERPPPHITQIESFEIFAVMLDSSVCNREDLPCHRPLGRTYSGGGEWPALAGLEVFWRPARNETQRVQDKVMSSFMKACAIGYTGDFIAFGRAYRAGLGQLDALPQERIVYSCVAASHFEIPFWPGTPGQLDLAEYFVSYQNGLNEAQSRYERYIDMWLKEQKYQSRFQEFKTFRWFLRQKIQLGL